MSRASHVLRRCWPLLVVLFASGIGCVPVPNLTGITPPTGYPRQLLGVQGTTLFASVIWDVGLPSEVSLYNGWLGTNYFQIPVGATPGVHPVALRNSAGTSGTLNVTVLAPSGAFPAPRIEDVGVLGLSGAGPVEASLTIAGANIDVDATVTVNGAAPTYTIRWGALPVNYLQAHTPATFGYPVYHYVQLLAISPGLVLGSTVNITVTNTDGQTANATYTMPGTVAELDSDGDGLLNSWEDGDFTAPSGNTISLTALGTNAWRKNILVEVDWIAAAAPNATIWATIEAAFAAAPVLNPDGSAGVTIIIDRGQGGAFTGGGTVLADHTTMDFGPSTAVGYTDFYTYKGASFDVDRLNIFHYGVFGRARPNGTSGVAEVWGNDFMVTFVGFAAWAQALAQVGTFIHEFGHNLGLTHGDNNSNAVQWNENQKPNFATSMSYRWQFPGVSIDCNWASELIHTYSQGYYARIVESAVNENIGICDNAPLDMNGSGTISAAPIAIDFQGTGTTTMTHDDFDQWGNLLLKFRAAGSRWNNN